MPVPTRTPIAASVPQPKRRAIEGVGKWRGQGDGRALGVVGNRVDGRIFGGDCVGEHDALSGVESVDQAIQDDGAAADRLVDGPFGQR